jgi:hypothetical protein
VYQAGRKMHTNFGVKNITEHIGLEERKMLKCNFA